MRRNRSPFQLSARASALSGLLLLAAGCGVVAQQPPVNASADVSQTVASGTQLSGDDPMTGDVALIRDPTLANEGKLWYVVSTDDADLNPADGHLPIHCSADRVHWRLCGHIFQTLPAWIPVMVPALSGLWAPDLSYFNGEWHLYYAASRLLSQVSVIGVATSPTLDQASADYAWTDHGAVIASHLGDDFNALDPNIVFDRNHLPWLNYGSFWSGIRQRPIDPNTGLLLTGGTTYDLASSPNTGDHAVEAASMLRNGDYYYLFASTGHCCDAELARDDYNIIVGRSHSLHGPFVDEQGSPMMDGGGTVLLSGGKRWLAPGSASAWSNESGGDDLLAFHALDLSDSGEAALWLLPLTWKNDWPQLQMPPQ